MGKQLCRLTVLCAIVAFTFIPGQSTSRTAAQSGRQVIAYYFGWHTSDSWNDGRLIDHPQRGNYNSADEGVISAQIQEAKHTGINGFVMSWHMDLNDVFASLLNQSSNLGFSAGASVDLDAGPAGAGKVQQEVGMLINNYVDHPAYLRYQGKPLIFFWLQGKLSAQDWAGIRQATDPGHRTLWVLEGLDYLPWLGQGIFDGLYLFQTAWATDPGSTARKWLNKTLQAGGKLYIPTVLPGWDESRLAGRTNPTSPKDRSGGRFLTNSWNGAASANTDLILITSWNEFLENSYIEPSQNYGRQALDVLQPLIAAWKNGSSSASSGSSGSSQSSQPSQPSNSGGGGSIPPANQRTSVPSGAVRLGEFQVEWYCTNRGYGIALTNNQADWACTNKADNSVAVILKATDFDAICQATYKDKRAFAIQDQNKSIRAYTWSCYRFQ